MSDQLGSSTDNASPLSTWLEVWILALTQPSVPAYERIINDPAATSARAYTWILVTALIGYGISAFFQLAGDSEVAQGGLLVCGAPVAAVLSVGGFIIAAGLINIVARALGGSGTYPQLACAMAAYVAPLSLISSVISPLRVLGLLIVPLGLYGMALNVIAVKATHRFGWGEAIASSAVILALACAAAALIALLAVMGGGIEDVFSNIVDQLGTPQP